MPSERERLRWAAIVEAEADRLAAGEPINWSEDNDPEYDTTGILYTAARLLRDES